MAATRSLTATRIVLVIEFALIEILLVGLSSEYSANSFMQDWFSRDAWPVGDLLANYLAPALGLGVGLGGLVATVLLRRRNMPRKEIEEIAPMKTTN